MRAIVEELREGHYMQKKSQLEVSLREYQQSSHMWMMAFLLRERGDSEKIGQFTVDGVTTEVHLMGKLRSDGGLVLIKTGERGKTVAFPQITVSLLDEEYRVRTNQDTQSEYRFALVNLLGQAVRIRNKALESEFAGTTPDDREVLVQH